MLRIHLLGPLRLFVDERPFKFLTSSRTVPLFAYLLLHGRAPVQRNWLAYTLWPDSNESDARGNLRRFLHELRHLLPPAEDEQPWILADASTVQWNPDAALWLDIDAFEQAATTVPAEAIALYTGDLLPDLYEDWIIADRERLRNRFLDTLMRLLQDARHARAWTTAIGYAQQLLYHDPLREDAVRELMIVRNAAGDRAGALHEYQRFDQRIRSELGVPPMLETSALYDSIAKQLAPPPTSAASAANTPFAPSTLPLAGTAAAQGDGAPPNNLPAQLTAFVGRERELAALQSLLGDERAGVRLLTLTGPGGSGKSRLAVEFAMRLRALAPERFPDGLFLVGLAGVRAPAQVLPTIAETLRVTEMPGQPLIESVRAFLRPRRMLLLLDNFEHLLESAPFITHLLAAAQGVRIVVTSRAALRIYGEHEFQVQPLPVPAADTLPSPGDLARVASVALFVARSRAVNPAFTLNAENAADIARICIDLDGLPLALELAAARSKLLSPGAILARLEHRLSFLVARDRQAHDRHQTLRAALDWSYNLLPAAEQRLFRRLAVFAASFTVEGAEALCADADDTDDILAGVESLLDNSLLQPLSEDSGDGEPLPGLGDAATSSVRLRMLATVRDYALERLAEQQDDGAAHTALAHLMLALLQKSQKGLRGGAQGAWLRLLELEHDNLRAALRWCLGPAGDPRLGLELGSKAALFWLVAGHWREGIEWLQQALDACRDATPEETAPACTGLGFLIMARGDLAPAIPYFEEAVRLYRQAEDAAGLADALFGLGRLYTRQRRFAAGEALIQESLAIAQAIGYEWRVAYALIVLAMIALETDELSRAAEQTALALESARRVQNKVGMAQMYTAQGEIARAQGDYAAAERDYNQALALAQELGQKARIMMVQHNLGHVALYNGQVARAAAHFREALRLGQELPDKENFGMCLLGLGGIAAAQGELRRAGLLFGAGEAALLAIGADLAPADRIEYERNLARARALPGSEALDAFRREGRTLSADAAAILALQG